MEFDLFTSGCEFIDDSVITVAIVEAFFGILAVLKTECRGRIDPEMCRVLEAFDETIEQSIRNKINYK